MKSEYHEYWDKSYQKGANNQMVTERKEDTKGQSYKVDSEIVAASGSTYVSQNKKS